MPEISRFYGIIIAMYYNEHNPPHFHAKYGEFQAEIDIRTLQIIKGELPKRAKTLFGNGLTTIVMNYCKIGNLHVKNNY